jgi:hypothetical protein
LYLPSVSFQLFYFTHQVLMFFIKWQFYFILNKKAVTPSLKAELKKKLVTQIAVGEIS